MGTPADCCGKTGAVDALLLLFDLVAPPLLVPDFLDPLTAEVVGVAGSAIEDDVGDVAPKSTAGARRSWKAPVDRLFHRVSEEY